MKKRLFIAVPLSGELQKTLGEYVKDAPNLDYFQGSKIRWTASENIHLTVCFFGSVEEKYLEGIKAVINRALSEVQHFSLTFKELRLAPEKRPRMIWGVFQPSPEFNFLVEEVAKSLEKYFRESLGRKIKLMPDREIVPHATLARFRILTKPPGVLPPVYLKSKDILVSSCLLFASQTLPTGSVYTQLAEFKLDTE